ncbi:sensor histidine kinase RegB [Gemmobacter serpentinus]|uniref:sensor histidine kinase RegB n=1 Tax=Gemmobacter serpentinus TaxID=2652247 RepID=UPI00124C6C89|nr:ActS/PrrB/RegB family redox-sensitive histidine kinase [Gemmobacter serpentinus]
MPHSIRSDLPQVADEGVLHLRTLILIRWAAITGQIVTLLIAHSVFEIGFPLGLCALVVGASIIVNLVLVFLFPESIRLNEHQVFLTLMFDLAQLALLLWLTGGLTNPFILLIVAPVTISATALSARVTFFLGCVAIVCVSVLSVTYLPLTLPEGRHFSLPSLFAFGFWLAVVIGIAFLGAYAHRVSAEIHRMQDALLATQMALARAQKLTDLGGVVAAAAHELGTPLATIKLVSTEMMDELTGDQRADAELIRDQADRCREILRGMGRAGRDDLQLRQTTLDALLREAAEPHMGRGKQIDFQILPAAPAQRPPQVQRHPEIIHGLRNLIQNAVDFADSQVWVSAEWGPARLRLRIRDDGPGYPAQAIGRLGEPFMRNRRSSEPNLRPGYEGMGLGLFIAKTLLERTGARISFANASGEGSTGAIVELVWPLERIVAADGPLGQNPLNA